MDRIKVRMQVAQLVPGTILAMDICSGTGGVLLARGTVLTGYAIERLHSWSIELVDVYGDQRTARPIIRPLHRHSQEDTAFFDMYIESIETIGTLFDEMRFNKKIPLQDLQPITDGVLEQVLGVHGVLSRLRQVKSGDQYTYNHSLNVGIYAVLIGNWLGYEEKALRQLAMAGLLHDAGKAKIPSDILNKPSKLTPAEFAEMKRHTLYGYQLISNTVGISKHVAAGVLQHHERADGSGYPLKICSDKIHPFAKIIAVADIYDAVTSDRAYQKKRTPYVAADIIMAESFVSLDPVIVQKFLQKITSYFFNDQVRLNTGAIATIRNIDPLCPTRPLVQTDDGFINLKTEQHVQIMEVLR